MGGFSGFGVGLIDLFTDSKSLILEFYPINFDQRGNRGRDVNRQVTTHVESPAGVSP